MGRSPGGMGGPAGVKLASPGGPDEFANGIRPAGDPGTYDDHCVMWDGPEDDLAAPAPRTPRPKRRAQAPLDPALDRLRLPPPAGFLLVEPLPHPTPHRPDGGSSAAAPAPAV